MKGMIQMNEVVKQVRIKIMEKTAEALRKNNMNAFVVKNCSEAVETVRKILEKGDTITCGGSETLKESGVLDLMKSGEYNFLDRSSAKTDDEREEIYRKAYYADAYLTSSNAVTESGELYNVDGNCNRISAIAYGPKKVIFVVGYNKIVKNLDEAVERIKKISAPCNAERLGVDTPCGKTGECISLSSGGDMPKGCLCSSRMCCNYLVSSYQRHKGRFNVILVAEELGY